MELPPGYSLTPGETPHEVNLVMENGKVVGTFSPQDDPRDVALIAYQHESRVMAEMAYVERLLKQKRSA